MRNDSTMPPSSMPSLQANPPQSRPRHRPVYCTSCDNCRARKTKCDGKRPCTNCVNRYKRQNMLLTLNESEKIHVQCTYSPAKRRGPVPNQLLTSMMHNSAVEDWNSTRFASRHDMARPRTDFVPDPSMCMTVGAAHCNITGIAVAATLPSSLLPVPVAAPSAVAHAASNQEKQELIQRRLDHLNREIEAQHQQILQRESRAARYDVNPFGSAGGNGEWIDPVGVSSMNPLPIGSNFAGNQPALRSDQFKQGIESMTPRVSSFGSDNHVEEGMVRPRNDAAGMNKMHPWRELPPAVASLVSLLDESSELGSRLRASYQLSLMDMFRLPCTPSDAEWFGDQYMGPTQPVQPKSHWMVLLTVRFAELSLGAMMRNAMDLVLELDLAARECGKMIGTDNIDGPIMFEVAKANFLFAITQLYQSDAQSFISYRNACLSSLEVIQQDDRSMALLAAVSYVDAWWNMTGQQDIPTVGMVSPTPFSAPLDQSQRKVTSASDDTCSDKTSKSPTLATVSDKGAIDRQLKVYKSAVALPYSRALDAVSFVILTLCGHGSRVDAGATTNANVPELRRLVLSARKLLVSMESDIDTFDGLQLILSALDVFLDAQSQMDLVAAFSDDQIQGLLSVCNGAVYKPHLVVHAGPTYHMASNATILLYHALMAMKSLIGGDADESMLDEVVDTYIAARKMLTMQRRKFPSFLQCNAITATSNLMCRSVANSADANGMKSCASLFCRRFHAIASTSSSKNEAATLSRVAVSHVSLTDAEFDIQESYDPIGESTSSHSTDDQSKTRVLDESVLQQLLDLE